MKRIASAIFALATMVGGAEAATYTFDPSEGQFTQGVDNQGGWSNASTLTTSSSKPSYYIGATTATPTAGRNNFFTFYLGRLDLSNQQVISATLQLQKNSYAGITSSETVEFFDVTTAPSILNNPSGFSTAIYNDLGSGKSYGSLAFLPALNTTQELLTIPLTTAALADITAAAGGYFSIGGTCTTCSLSPAQRLFVGSNATGIQQLTLVTAPVPEPSEWASLVAGLFVVGFMAKRRRGLRS
jgi:hypothetical protein